MRKAVASGLVGALAVSLVPMTASARQATGTLNGTAQSAQGQALPNYTVRLRNTQSGQLAGSQSSNATGQFSFTGLNPSDYVVEIVDSTGNIVGTSTAVTVGAGSTVTISVSASALAAAAGGAAGAAGGAAAGGAAAGAAAGAGAAAAGIGTTIGTIAVAGLGAAVATTTAIVSNNNNASPSR